uniref:Uncharacterized protein n=1 Tax=Desulfovibrio sp. U5L TaxID=596152 RepID=I2Q5E1_9BACT
MPRIEQHNAIPTPAHLPPKTEAEIEAEALAWCERMENKFSMKKSNYKAKTRGSYESRNR